MTAVARAALASCPRGRRSLLTFASAAKADPDFAAELPKFLAAVWRVFNHYERVGYVATRRPAVRRTLRQLLFVA